MRKHLNTQQESGCEIVTMNDVLMNLYNEIKISSLLTKQQYGNAIRTNGMRPTSDPRFVCTDLPWHTRVKIALKVPFKVFALTSEIIPNKTRVTLTASSICNLSITVMNNETVMNNQIAEFQKLKFMEKSGRGIHFDLTIFIHTVPLIEIKVFNAIKVTADGIRKPRRLRKGGEDKKPCSRLRKNLLAKQKERNRLEDSIEKRARKTNNNALATVDTFKKRDVTVLPVWDLPTENFMQTIFSVQEKEDRLLKFLQDRNSLFRQWSRPPIMNGSSGFSNDTSNHTLYRIQPSSPRFNLHHSNFDFPNNTASSFAPNDYSRNVLAFLERSAKNALPDYAFHENMALSFTTIYDQLLLFM